jgi:hypothetical protein
MLDGPKALKGGLRMRISAIGPKVSAVAPVRASTVKEAPAEDEDHEDDDLTPSTKSALPPGLGENLDVTV